MIEQIKPFKDRDLYVFKFDNFADYLDTLKLSVNDTYMKLEYESRPYRYGDSWEDCQNYLSGKPYIKSTKDLIKQANFSEKVFQQGEPAKHKLITSFAGSKPMITNYIQGKPNTMMRYKKEPHSKPILNIILETTFSCRETKQNVEKHFKNIFGRIIALTLKGYAIRLSLLNTYNIGTEKNLAASLIRLKSENESLNIAKLAYPCCSLSMFRLVSLRGFYNNYFCKRYPNEETGSAGASLCYQDSKYRADFLQNLAEPGSKLIYLSFTSDVERTFEGL